MIIFSNVIKRIMTKKSNLLFMLILPTVLSTFIVLISTTGNKYTVGIIDNDNTAFTRDFNDYLSQTCKIVDVKKEHVIEDKILNDGVECILVFQKGYTDALIHNDKAKVKSYFQEGSNYAEPIQMKVASYLSAAELIGASCNQNEDEFYKGMKDFREKDLQVDYLYAKNSFTEKTDAAVTSFGYVAFCMLFLMAFSTSLIMEDKVSGVTERLWITPVAKASYYVQHVLAYFLISVIQTVVVILVLPLFGKVSFGTSFLEVTKVIIICLIFSLSCIAMGVAINTYAKNKLAAGSISSLINLPILMLGGCFWPSEDMPVVLQKIGSFLPTAWFLKAAKGVVLYGKSLFGVVQYIGLLFAFTIVILGITFIMKSKNND